MAAKKLEQTSDEKWLNDAIREGRAVKMELSMKAIGNPDMTLQQRVDHLDVMHVARLERMIRDGTAVYPIVVFRDPDTKKDRVADGFHRHEAHRKAGLASIWAWVIEGTYRDALIYSTMCNQLALLQRKPEDIRKAIWAMFSIDDWFASADTVIARHCGVSPNTVARSRKAWCKEKNAEPPEQIRIEQQGKTIVVDRIKTRVTDKPKANVAPVHADMKRFAEWAAASGILFEVPSPIHEINLSGLLHRDAAIVLCDSVSRERAFSAIARVQLFRSLRSSNQAIRAIVVTRDRAVFGCIPEAARSFGVEFLTPDEFIASLQQGKSDEEAPTR